MARVSATRHSAGCGSWAIPTVRWRSTRQGRTVIDWGVTAAPETFLVDGKGNVIYKYISAVTDEVWQREFLPRIAAARRAGA